MEVPHLPVTAVVLPVASLVHIVVVAVALRTCSDSYFLVSSRFIYFNYLYLMLMKKWKCVDSELVIATEKLNFLTVITSICW